MRWLKLVHRWIIEVWDPRKTLRALTRFPRYLRDARRYSRFLGAERLSLVDTMPRLHDRTSTTPFDAHYFYTNGWAIRKILELGPEWHMDVGSDVMFTNMLSATMPTIFVDYRPLTASIENLISVGADITGLPIRSRSIRSLSCLHVAEHIGLGRYGDPLDPRGTVKAAGELTRVLATGGDLLFAVPVGRPRVCFNAHRVHSVGGVLDLFPELELIELSGVTDDGTYLRQAGLHAFDNSEYACGLFWLRRP